MEKRVLVVDDDEPTRVMLEAVLKREAFAVDLCRDGQQAAARIQKHRYGAIVLTLVRSDAPSDTAILSRLEKEQAPPGVILISAGSQTAMDAVASDLIRARLRKPFAIEELVGAIKECFAG